MVESQLDTTILPWNCLVDLPWIFYCINGPFTMMIIFKKYFDVDKKLILATLSSLFVPFIALELPCGITLDLFMV